MMTTEAQNILRSFDMLPDSDKQEVALEILRRSLDVELPPLSDEQLLRIAEERFLDLDRSEAGHA